jgi:hypothetical protein
VGSSLVDAPKMLLWKKLVSSMMVFSRYAWLRNQPLSGSVLVQSGGQNRAVTKEFPDALMQVESEKKLQSFHFQLNKNRSRRRTLNYLCCVDME